MAKLFNSSSFRTYSLELKCFGSLLEAVWVENKFSVVAAGLLPNNNEIFVDCRSFSDS